MNAIKIINRTCYVTAHLRGFVAAILRRHGNVERPPKFPGGRWARPRLYVTFKPSRRRLHGRAVIRGSATTIWVPPNADKRELVVLIAHEVAHLRGRRGEHDMRHQSNTIGWADGWRERAAWADELPLEMMEAAATSPSVQDQLKAAQLALTRWQTKAKRAATYIKKYERRIRRLEAKQ